MLFITIITSIFLITCVIYTGTFLFARLGIKKLHRVVPGHTGEFVSVIIAARNEEKCIRQTLQWVLNQDYPPESYEVILVNDASTDRTMEIALEFAACYPQLHIISQPVHSPYISRKKYALEKGIAAAMGEILLFTDSDASGSARWIRSMAAAYDREGTVGAVCGFVCLPHRQEGTFFHHFQETEYLMLSLVGIGYGSQGLTVSSNGNNFSYRKSLFREVGGFNGINHIKSGDDDLLLEKFSVQTGKKIVYCYKRDAIVETAPMENFGSLANQRSRWASKVFVYKRFHFTCLLLSIFIFNILLLIFPVLFLFAPVLLPVYAAGILLKWLADGLVILPELKHLNRRALARRFLPVELLHVPYLVYIGFRGTLGNFQWKDIVDR